MKKEIKKANFLYHLACTKCDSSDGYGAYDDGWGKCFACNETYKWDTNENKGQVIQTEFVVEEKAEVALSKLEEIAT